jgi:predicted GNAT family N-acyltransferase
MFMAIWKLGAHDIELAKSIRRAVFIEEMGLPESEVFDARDAYSAHLEVFEEDTLEPIATARMYPDFARDNCDCCAVPATHIGEIAVMKQYRDTNQYYDFALRMLLYKAQSLSGQKLVADIFPSELPFYEAFGFKSTDENTTAGKIRVAVDKEKVRMQGECHTN